MIERPIPSRRRWRVPGLLALLVVVAAACQPVTHPDHVVVDPAATLSVLALSGDGNHAVVDASAASDSVPGPGLWRVDRRDGTAVQLPTGSSVVRMSDDGQRVLLGTDQGDRIWNQGTLVTPPVAGWRMNEDLTYAIYRGILNPRLIRWELATGAVTAFGPPNVTWGSLGISDDGAIAWARRFGEATCRTHFFDVATGSTSVHDACLPEVSADGRHFLVRSDPVEITDLGGNVLGGPTRLRLFASDQPGVVVAEATASEHGPDGPTTFSEIHLADAQPAFWAAEVCWFSNMTGPCGTPSSPPCVFHEETVDLVVGTPQATKSLAVDPDVATAYVHPWSRSSITEDGRFFFFSMGGEIHVQDRFGDRLEVLTNDVGSFGRPLLSDDARVVVAGHGNAFVAGTGWVEFRAAEPPPDQG